MTDGPDNTSHPPAETVSAQSCHEERIVPLRLQKFLARAGVASRRGSEKLMTSGRVTVNGKPVCELGSRVDPNIDVVAVDGVVVSCAGSCVYLLLNKPAGVVTTMSDPQGRPCVAELVPCDEYPGLFPVGRLDQDTTGALLFMTDGELANRLLHPSSGVVKRYIARVEGEVCEDELDILRQGVMLDDGPAAPAEVAISDTALSATEVVCSIHEGRKHQVKRMFEAIGHPVIRLHRAAFGPLELGALETGSWRMLTEAELASLRYHGGA